MNDATELVAFVADRDVPCPGCSYNLRGLQTGSCPECNQLLALRVGLAETKLGWWIAALIGAACGFGFNALLGVYAVITALRGSAGPMHPFLTIIGAGFIVFAGVLGFTVLKGRRIRRSDTGSRIALSAVLWGLAFVDVLVFSLCVR